MRLALVSLIVTSSLGLVGTAGTIGVVDYFAGDLPSIESLQSTKLNQTTRILDRNGTLIEALYHLCVVIALYGVLSSPILGLAEQGAEALGLR